MFDVLRSANASTASAKAESVEKLRGMSGRALPSLSRITPLKAGVVEDHVSQAAMKRVYSLVNSKSMEVSSSASPRGALRARLRPHWLCCDWNAVVGVRTLDKSFEWGVHLPPLRNRALARPTTLQIIRRMLWVKLVPGSD
jgi:hypothetical protein